MHNNIYKVNSKDFGLHKGDGVGLPSKRKPKIQPKSPKIGVSSPEVVLVPAASLEAALLPANAGEEA